MHSQRAAIEWISEYLEWTRTDIEPFDVEPLMGPVDVDAASRYAYAYFEWMDARRIGRVPDTSALRAGTREAILLAALRAESDCMRVMQRVIDAGDSSSRAVTLVREAIERAERLIDTESPYAAQV